MKRIKKSRVSTKAASATVLASLIFLTACGGGGGGSAASKEQDASGKVTLNFITQSSPLAPTDPNEKLINKRLEEKTNVHINWKNFTKDVFVEKETWLWPVVIYLMLFLMQITVTMSCLNWLRMVPSSR